MRFVKYLSIVVLLLTFSFPSFASSASSTASTQADIEQIISAQENTNDDFHKILSNMWGGFIFGDVNAKPTLLAEIVGYVNVLALVLGIIIVTYVSVASVINSAQSGEVLGKQWSSYWLPIRTAAAFGLLVPTQAGAFALSTAQIIVLKLVIMASTSATFLWQKSVDSALNINDARPTIIMPYKLAYETSLTSICAVTFARERNWGDPSVISFSFTDDTTSHILEDDAEMVEGDDVQGLVTKLSGIASSISSNKLLKSVEFWEGNCGSISFNIPDFDVTKVAAFTENATDVDRASDIAQAMSKSEQKLIAYQKYYVKFISDFLSQVVREKNANARASNLRQIRDMNRFGSANIFAFESVATSYLNELENEDKSFSLTGKDSTGQGNVSSTADKVLARMDPYKRVVDSFINKIEDLYINNPIPITTSDGTADRLTKGGWIYAGSFFYQISKIEERSNSASSAMISGSSSAGVVKCGGCSDGSLQIANSELISLMYKNIYISPITISGTILDGKKSKYPEALSVPLVSAYSMNDQLNEGIVSDAFSAFAVNKLAEFGKAGFSDNNLSGDKLGDISDNNPFQFAVNIGHGMNNLRYFLGLVKLAATTAIYTVDFSSEGVSSSAVGFFGGGVAMAPVMAIIKAMATMLLELITIAFTLLTAMAWILAYYIPMMPALLWITLVGAYLLIVIEAVVATPLAVVLMATPEGEGISGSKMQNAITLLASVYLRPSLMIVGLIAAIYVAKYSFMILNVIFWSQAESAVSGDLFAFFAIFSLYITALHQVLSNSIKSMDSLPTAILNWIGQGANAQFGQNEVAGAGEQLSQKESSFGNTGDAFKSAFENKMNQTRHNEVKSALDKPTGGGGGKGKGGKN